tara:strand:- start:1748 stop:2437 length:690 start_codon:yes stop_codon:yes gene_type:complete
MELKEENVSNENEKTLVCNKGDMILQSYKKNNNTAYNLKYDFNNLDPNKVNIKALLCIEIYELLEKINPEFIEKIIILNKLNENESDICILLRQIGKEVGIKQKYILFRTTRGLNYFNNSIVFYNKDLSQINPDLIPHYIKQYNLDLNKYDPMIFNYGKTNIVLNNLEHGELNKLSNDENFNNNINIDFTIDFQMLINDDLPIYMEDLIGLMFKKMFYNLKLFIDNLNK